MYERRKHDPLSRWSGVCEKFSAAADTTTQHSSVAAAATTRAVSLPMWLISTSAGLHACGGVKFLESADAAGPLVGDCRTGVDGRQ